MKKVILAELNKLPNQTNYILFAILATIVIGLGIITFSTIPKELNQQAAVRSIVFLINPIELFVAIFLILNVGQEFKNGTLRKNIIDGYTRHEFYIGKIILLLLAATFSFLFYLLSFILISIPYGLLETTLSLLTTQLLGIRFISIIYKALFVVSLSFLLKRTTLVFVFYFLWEVMEQIINGIYLLAITAYEINSSFSLADFLPLSSFKAISEYNNPITLINVIVTSTYIIIMLFIPYFTFQKSNIKP